MKELQVSLYDIFGYVAPGLIAFLGIYLIWWRLTLPIKVDWSTITTSGWIAIFIVAYFMGHAIQALANLLFKRFIKESSESYELNSIKNSSQQLYNSIANKACRVSNIAAGTQLSPSVIFEIADNYLMQYGKTETRDIYVYREGFYRGFMFSLLIFMIGAFAGMTGPDLAIKIFGITLWCTSGFLGSLALTAAGISFLSFQRFKRFSAYRVRNSLFGFLIVENS